MAPASTIASPPAHLKLNNLFFVHYSSGIRSYHFVDMYHCAFYFLDKRKQIAFSDLAKLGDPVAIRVEVLTSMLPDRMPDVWRESIKPEIMDKAFRRFQKGFLNLEEGDVLVFMYLPGQATSLFLNEKLLFTDPGPGLMEALIEQWVGPHPISEELKKALLGG